VQHTKYKDASNIQLISFDNSNRLYSWGLRLAATSRGGNKGEGIDMALPKGLQPTLTPDELSFLSEEDVIDIVPLFSMTRVRLLSVSSFLGSAFFIPAD
jgi:hypothetical protein